MRCSDIRNILDFKVSGEGRGSGEAGSYNLNTRSSNFYHIVHLLNFPGVYNTEYVFLSIYRHFKIFLLYRI